MTNGQICLNSTKDKANPLQNFLNSLGPYIRQPGSGLILRASLDLPEVTTLPWTIGST